MGVEVSVMRGFAVPVLMGVLLVASCGGSGNTRSTEDTSASSSAPIPVSTSTVPESTAIEITVPPATPPAAETAVDGTTTENTIRPPAAVTVRYAAPVDLGTLPGGSKSMAVDINNSEVIVGFSYVGTFEQYAVWWPDTTSGPQRLDGYLSLRFDTQQSIAHRVNDAGQILVSVQPQAFVVDPVAGSSIEVVPPFDEGFQVQDLNEFGQVVGSVNIEWPDCGDDGEPNPITRGFVWDSATGETTIIGPLDGAESSAANSINDLGQVVGASDGRPFIWDPDDGTMAELEVPEVEHLVWASANDINNRGVIVGVAQYVTDAQGPSMRALIWDTTSGEVLDLSSVLAVDRAGAQMLNDSGQVVCRMGQTGSDPWILDLASNTVSMVPDVTFGYGVSINDHGQAVGMSAERAALWNPIA
jgi:uncharacterized membrane protein